MGRKVKFTWFHRNSTLRRSTILKKIDLIMTDSYELNGMRFK